MAHDLVGLGRVRVYQDTTQPFSLATIDSSAAIGSYRDVRHIDADISPGRTMVANESTTQRMFQRNPDVVGFRDASIQLKSQLCPTGTALTTAATATKTTQSLMLETILGGYSAAAGSVVVVGSTATSLVVTATHGARFPVGSLIGVQYAAGVQIARVTAVATDTLTVSGLSGSPTVGNAVYNAQTVFQTPDPTGSLHVVVQRPDLDNTFWGFGGQGSLEFDLGLGSIPSFSTTLKFADWRQNAAAATPLAGALGAATYDGGSPFVYQNGQMLLGDFGGAMSSVHVTAITFSPNISYAPIPSPEGINGVRLWRLQKSIPMLSITFPYDDPAYLTKRDASTFMTGQFRIGTVAGQMLVFDFPRMQIKSVSLDSSNNIRQQKIDFELDEDTNSTATALANAPWRLAQM